MKQQGILIVFLLLISQTTLAKSADERIKALEDRWAQYEASKIDQNSKLAEAIAQLDRMRAEIQALGGGSETQNVQMRQIQDSVERHYRDLEMRLNAVEGQLKLFQDELSRAIAKVAPQIAEEGRQFQKGLTHVQNGEYTQAIGAFDQFIKANPKSPHRSEALFWIGECRYAMKDYSQAIKDYQKFVEQFSRSNKAPLAMLKQGDAFINLQMKEEARVFWKELLKKYPNSDEAAQAQRKLDVLAKTGGAPTTSTPAPQAPSAPPKQSQDF